MCTSPRVIPIAPASTRTVPPGGSWISPKAKAGPEWMSTCMIQTLRPKVAGLIHHCERGVQYLAIRYTERLAEIGAVTSVGSRGDSYDNAAAESLIGLFETELIRRRGPWRGLDDVELATLEWVDWFNNRRLHSACGDVPPVEFKEEHYRQIAALETLETLETVETAEPSLH